jgi:hypothetical protein
MPSTRSPIVWLLIKPSRFIDREKAISLPFAEQFTHPLDRVAHQFSGIASQVSRAADGTMWFHLPPYGQQGALDGTAQRTGAKKESPRRLKRRGD